MGKQIKTKALVLHGMSVGDYDKRLILLTKEVGKIDAFAKGCKKPNSKLLAGSEIFSYGDFILYKGKQSYNVNSIDLIESFHSLRQDIDQLTYGLYVLEFVSYVSEEGISNHDIMKLTLKTLKILENKKQSLELVARIYELKAMSFVGFSPWVYNCTNCNTDENLNFFSAKEGGVLCSKCSTHNDATKISSGTLYTMQYILSTDINHVFNFKVNKVILSELAKVMRIFIEYNLNKKFNALQYLDFQKNFL